MTKRDAEQRHIRGVWLRVTAIALLAALLALIGGTVWFANQVERTASYSDQQVRLNAQMDQLQDVWVALADAETGQRGYLLTGKVRYLVPYQAAMVRMPELLDSLDDAQADVVSSEQLKRIRELVSLKLSELAETIRLRDSGQSEAAMRLVQSDRGQSYMEETRDEIARALRAMTGKRDSLTAAIADAGNASRQIAVWTVSTLVLFVCLGGAQLVALARTRSQYERALSESESRHRAIVEEQEELISIASEDGTLIYVNPAHARHFSRNPDDMVGMNLFDFVADSDRDAVRQQIAIVLETGLTLHGENRVVLADGEEVWVAWTNQRKTGANGERLLHAVGRDITAVVDARDALKRQTATLQSVIEAIPAMVCVFDADLKYRMVNRAFERWRGTGREAVIDRRVRDVMGAAEQEASRTWMQRALAGETASCERHFPDARQNRYLHITYVPLYLEDGRVDGIISIAQDITAHREEEKRLLDLNERDPLTGLLNRTGFANRLTRNVEAGKGPTLAVLYIDLDRFKAVNDGHGHSVGDRLLTVFAERLQNLVRPADFVARLGGDEFAIAIEGVRNPSAAYRVADAVIEAASTPFEIGGLTISVGASIGVAVGTDETLGWQSLVERADVKVYEAKAAGRGRRAQEAAISMSSMDSA